MEGVRLLEGEGIPLGWAFGRTLEKWGNSLALELLSRWEMVAIQDFGGTFEWGALSRKIHLTLFRIASHKNATAAELLEREGGGGGYWKV